MAKNKKIKKEKEKFEFEVKDKFDDEDLFDDCPVCQAEKLAQKQGRTATLTELLAAFQKAKDKGAVVGGKYFEKTSKTKETKGSV